MGRGLRVYGPCLPINDILFFNETFESENLKNILVLRSPDYENHVFGQNHIGMCVRVSVISITQK